MLNQVHQLPCRPASQRRPHRNFKDANDEERVYYLTHGRVTPVLQAEPYVKLHIDDDMGRYPEKVEALVGLGYEEPDLQREKYCGCCFGAFDNTPDVVMAISGITNMCLALNAVPVG